MHICRNGCLNQIFLILFDFPFPSGLGAYAPDYLGGVSFAGDYIIASYSGKDNTLEDYQPTCFIIFDKTGDYLKTIETGYRIDDFCYDKDNNRIIMVLNDNIQFAYFDLNYII